MRYVGAPRITPSEFMALQADPGVEQAAPEDVNAALRARSGPMKVEVPLWVKLGFVAVVGGVLLYTVASGGKLKRKSWVGVGNWRIGV